MTADVPKTTYVPLELLPSMFGHDKQTLLAVLKKLKQQHTQQGDSEDDDDLRLTINGGVGDERSDDSDEGRVKHKRSGYNSATSGGSSNGSMEVANQSGRSTPTRGANNHLRPNNKQKCTCM